MKKKRIDKAIKKQEEKIKKEIKKLEKRKKVKWKGSIKQKIGGPEKTAIEGDKIAEKELEEEDNRKLSQKNAS